MRKNYKVLITGATGFIGRRLAPRATRLFKKEDILCLIWNQNNTQEGKGRRILESAGLATHEIDLVTGEGLRDIPQSPNLVIHMAANTDTSDYDHRCNDLGTKNLLRALKLGPKNHIVFTSTLVLYAGRKDCSKPINEKTPPSPSNEYGRSKFRAERILAKACKKHKFRLTILRFNTVHGKDPKPNTLFKILRQMVERSSLLTRLNWPGLSGIIFVDDVAQAILALSKESPKPGKPELYILNPESLTFAQMSKLMHKALRTDYRPINLPEIFWKFAKYARNYSPKLEKITPPKNYSWLWRASLIVDDVIYTNTSKAYKVMPDWKPKKLKDVIKELV